MDHSEYYDKYIHHRDSSCFFCGEKGKLISVGIGYRNLCESEECVKRYFRLQKNPKQTIEKCIEFLNK